MRAAASRALRAELSCCGCCSLPPPAAPPAWCAPRARRSTAPATAAARPGERRRLGSAAFPFPLPLTVTTPAAPAPRLDRPPVQQSVQLPTAPDPAAAPGPPAACLFVALRAGSCLMRPTAPTWRCLPCRDPAAAARCAPPPSCWRQTFLFYFFVFFFARPGVVQQRGGARAFVLQAEFATRPVPLPAAAACRRLQANQYQNRTGQAACVLCPAGSSTSDTGNTQCYPCPLGTYSTSPGRQRSGGGQQLLARPGGDWLLERACSCGGAAGVAAN